MLKPTEMPIETEAIIGVPMSIGTPSQPIAPRTIRIGPIFGTRPTMASRRLRSARHMMTNTAAVAHSNVFNWSAIRPLTR